MLTMKQFLALIATVAAAACHAESTPAGPMTSGLRQGTAEKPPPSTSAVPRQLSAQERAELRRQLYQYSRVAGKGS
ncbi:MAG TPA: hypothetical protein VN649_09475 [Ramlibacter sp.]|nr:hypothetical protein [Ramlibacter sp.]